MSIPSDVLTRFARAQISMESVFMRYTSSQPNTRAALDDLRRKAEAPNLAGQNQLEGAAVAIMREFLALQPDMLQFMNGSRDAVVIERILAAFEGNAI